MREILFRAKRLDNGEWVEGYLYVTHNGEYEIGKYNEYTNIERYTYIVDPESICQYTGLNDKNGMKIFEGDIVKTKNGIGYIVYATGCFSVQDFNSRNNPAIDIVMSEGEIEVIDNIHNNLIY